MLWLPTFLESASPPCLWDVCRVSITPQLSVSACKHREMQVQTPFKTLQNEDKRRQMAPEHLKLCSKKTPPAPKPQGRSERHLKLSTSSSQIQTYKAFFLFLPSHSYFGATTAQNLTIQFVASTIFQLWGKDSTIPQNSSSLTQQHQSIVRRFE